MELTALDRQKSRLVIFFSALGLAGFLLNLVAGIGLWSYSGSREVDVPTYDRFIGELRSTSDAQLPDLAKTTFERWSACETTRSGMSSAAVHALVSASVAGIAFFTICFLLSLQVHKKINALVGVTEAPQPPEPVDDTWRGRD